MRAEPELYSGEDGPLDEYEMFEAVRRLQVRSLLRQEASHSPQSLSAPIVFLALRGPASWVTTLLPELSETAMWFWGFELMLKGFEKRYLPCEP